MSDVIDQILTLLQAHAWAGLGGLVVMTCVTLLTDRSKFLPTWNSPWRTFLGTLGGAIGLSLSLAQKGGTDTMPAIVNVVLTALPTLIAELKVLGKKVPSEGAVLLLLAIGLAGPSTGCAGSLESSKATTPKASLEAGVSLSDHCLNLDAASRTWGAIAKGAGALSGATGISTLPIPDTDRGARTIVVSASTVLAAVAITAMFVADSDTNDWARDCANVAPAGAK